MAIPFTFALQTGPIPLSELDSNFTYLNVRDNGLFFTTTGLTISGDFSNAIESNKVSFITTTVNGNTIPSLYPNGTGTLAGFSTPTVPMAFFTGGSERMRIDTSGNVGIGRSPTSKLDVYDATATVNLQATSGSVISQNYASSSGGIVALGAASNHPTIFVTNSTERFRIGTSGELGIGGINNGTSGQVLKSQGTGLPVVWGANTTTPIQSMVRVQTANGYGSTNNKIRRYTNTVTNVGTDITYADSATLGASFTINTNGVYAVSISEQGNAATTVAVTLNTTQPTADPSTLTNNSEILCIATTYASGWSACASGTFYLASSSVVRPHTGGIPAGTTTNENIFTITRVN